MRRNFVPLFSIIRISGQKTFNLLRPNFSNDSNDFPAFVKTSAGKNDLNAPIDFNDINFPFVQPSGQKDVNKIK